MESVLPREHVRNDFSQLAFTRREMQNALAVLPSQGLLREEPGIQSAWAQRAFGSRGQSGHYGRRQG
jgi:hypothetical protein